MFFFLNFTTQGSMKADSEYGLQRIDRFIIGNYILSNNREEVEEVETFCDSQTFKGYH